MVLELKTKTVAVIPQETLLLYSALFTVYGTFHLPSWTTEVNRSLLIFIRLYTTLIFLFISAYHWTTETKKELSWPGLHLALKLALYCALQGNWNVCLCCGSSTSYQPPFHQKSLMIGTVHVQFSTMSWTKLGFDVTIILAKVIAMHDNTPIITVQCLKHLKWLESLHIFQERDIWLAVFCSRVPRLPVILYVGIHFHISFLWRFWRNCAFSQWDAISTLKWLEWCRHTFVTQSGNHHRTVC